MSAVEHQRTILLSNIDLAIASALKLRETQPPFSEAGTKLCDDTNQLRALRHRLERIDLHG